MVKGKKDIRIVQVLIYKLNLKFFDVISFDSK